MSMQVQGLVSLFSRLYPDLKTLYRCRQVCQEWQRATRDIKVWQTFAEGLYAPNEEVTADQLETRCTIIARLKKPNETLDELTQRLEQANAKVREIMNIEV